MSKNLSRNLNSKFICVIDIGSNTIRTTVYLLDGYSYTVVYKDKYICNFTKGLSANNNLSAQVINKALKYLTELKRSLKGFKLNSTIAVATSAMRLAKNARTFTSKAELILETRIQVISGKKEAELSVKGVELEAGKLNGLVLDLGGGSLELSHVNNTKTLSLASVELGHQTLALKAKAGVDKLRAYIQKNLKSIRWLGKSKYPNVYLSGGKFRKLAKLNMQLTRGKVEDVKAYKISKKKLLELIKIKNKDPNNKAEAQLLYYTAILLDELINLIEAEYFVFCGNSIREGLLAEFNERSI